MPVEELLEDIQDARSIFVIGKYAIRSRKRGK